MARKDTSQNIFVTGATGFVGSYMCRYLVHNGYTNVFGLRRKNSLDSLVLDFKENIHWLDGNILDIPFLEKIFLENKFDVVIHCAAMVSFYHKDRKLLYEVNVEGTENIVNVCLAHKISKLIHVSSIATLGKSKEFSTLDENSKWVISNLNSYYSVTKYQAEQEVWRGIAEGLTACIVNPSIILGAQFWSHGTGKLFEQIESGLKLYTPGGSGYVDVRDVVKFILLLLESKIENERFILNAENKTFKSLFESIAEALHKSKPKIAANSFLRGVAWRVEWLRSVLSNHKPLITRETARSAATTFYFDNSKSLKTFSNFNYNSIEETIKETAKVFIESRKEGKNFGILKSKLIRVV